MIDRTSLARYLEAVLRGPVEILALHPLKDASAPAGEDPKGFGYRVPFGGRP